MNNSMWTVTEEVKTALEVLNFPPIVLQQLAATASKKIVERAKNKYVVGNPRAWWLNLVLPFKSYEYDFASDYLTQHVTGESLCYWIPETEESELVVYKTELDVIPKIMELTACFEYYVLGINLDWLLIQNDHNELIVVEG